MPLQKITKEEIMHRSLPVFLRQGYNRTTMDDLAKACGLFKGSFYYYFPNKEALMRATLEESLAFVEKNVFARAFDTSLPPAERLARMFEVQQQMLLGHGAGCIFGNTVLETALIVPEFREPMRRFFEAWEDALTHVFQTKLPESESRKWARETMAQVEGSLVLVLVREDEQYLKACFRAVYERFLAI
jgi:TetR/AcrR family transcriptional repressor of nem operon